MMNTSGKQLNTYVDSTVKSACAALNNKKRLISSLARYVNYCLLSLCVSYVRTDL